MSELHTPPHEGTGAAATPGTRTAADRVTIVHDGERFAVTLDGELVDLSASTVRVRLTPGTELPEGQQRFVVVVHRDPAVFVLADVIDGESEPEVFRFARVTRGS
jgi:hypothetical protein